MTVAPQQTIVRQDPSQTVVVVREESSTIVRQVETLTQIPVGVTTTVSQPGSTFVTISSQPSATILQPADYTIIQTTAIPGPQGPQGPAGPSGGSGEVWNQSGASTVWNITHSLGYFPAVNTFDSSGDEIEGDVKHPTMNTVVITFSSAVSGVAYLS